MTTSGLKGLLEERLEGTDEEVEVEAEAGESLGAYGTDELN